METFAQYKKRMAAETARECGCTQADAEACCAGSWWTEWHRVALDALLKGETPTQAWVNSARAGDSYWWERRVLHDHPDLADRLVRNGLSLLYSKGAWS